jgi:hypothetical protein
MIRNAKHCLNRLLLSSAIVFLLPIGSEALAGQLHVGGASVSITPEGPVAVSGQMQTRIAREVESEVTATALALESREGDEVLDRAVMVSCDLVLIRDGIPDKVRERIRDRIPDFDTDKLLMNGTHTHTGPVTRLGQYDIPEDAIKVEEYVEFLCDRVADAVVQAWETRKPGSVGWGLGHAIVAQNRRAVYADGTSVMYGSTSKPEFRNMEAGEDHGVEVLFFWNDRKELIATAIDVSCPAQEVESRSTVNADFWHPVRETLRAKHGKDLLVLGWIGAAGDQSPHLMYRKDAEERMRNLRGLTRLEEISRRIVHAWEEAYEGAKQEMHADVPLVHKVETIELPRRKVTEKEYNEVKAKIEELSKDPKNNVRVRWHQKVVDRYERQQADNVDPYKMELHAIRLGDIAIATNDFELFTNFGIQMKARSPALQTFIIQLAGPGTYVPTERAACGGGYSAIVESNEVGPEGGQVLADRTVEILGSLWANRWNPVRGGSPSSSASILPMHRAVCIVNLGFPLFRPQSRKWETPGSHRSRSVCAPCKLSDPLFAKTPLC